MLFSGGSASKPKKDEKKEKKSDRDEKYDIQENVFVRWGNSLLANEPLKDFRDLCDTKYIGSIAHIVTGISVTMSGNRYEDSTALIVQLSDTKIVPAELAECQQKAVLAIWWKLVEAFWKKFGPDPIREDKLTEAIKHWCLEVTRDYEEVSVCDFTSSWRDGHAFLCLLHNFDRKLINLKKMNECSASERLETAFSTAEKEFRVARLLSVKDLQSEHLDTRSVVCYLMTLYLSLLGKSSMATSTHSMEQSTSGAPAQTSSQHHHSHSKEQLPAQQQPGAPQLVHQGTVIHHQVPPPLPAAAQTPPTTVPQPAETPPSPLTTVPPAAVPSSSSPEGKQKARQQPSIDQPSDSVEVRSRKSSSSSQKSGRSRRERKEAMTREFENCLEQVLTWLLEAEEELSLLPPVEEKDVGLVRVQFKEFEQFMASLTDSQETVGRVLHRGQLLSNKADSEEEREAIQGQLLIVNQRWEELRAVALHRQTRLHTQLNNLQQRQLSSISRWLSSMEVEITDSGPLAATTETVLEQIEQHGRLQTKIDEFQPVMRALNAFVAVVDDGESAEESVASLEEAMREVGQRWQTVCSWAENRATSLDGLAEVVAQTAQVFERLSNWLKDREHELLGLKSAHHLEEPEQVAEQVRKLQAAEAALEAEHGQFVRLSQLSCELVARLDTGNGAAANDVRRRLDTVTQRWDNLVARIEEHSKTLVRSGKADLKQLKKYDRSVDDSLTIDESLKADRVLLPDEATSSVQVTTMEAVVSEGLTETTDTEAEEQGNVLVDRFLRHVAKLTSEMEPLKQWTETFAVSNRPDQVRRMISVCQEKLVEIKDQEAKVTRLQLELEHIHLSNSLNAKQLRKANDAFDTFAKGWARIVTKISEAMNVLTGHSDQGEETAVAQGIQDWIEGCDRVLADIARSNPPDRQQRIAKLQQQLKLQTNNLEFVEKDVVRRAILKKGLDIAARKISAAKGEEPKTQSPPEIEEDVLAELDGPWSSVGDVPSLEKDLERSTRLVEKARQHDMAGELVGRAETRKAEVEERRRSTMAALKKMGVAEATLKTIRSDVESVSRRDGDVSTVVRDLQEARERLASRVGERKEAERTTEKMIALDDNVPEQVVTTNRERVRVIVAGWRELDDMIEDHLSCARKEQRRNVHKAISDEEKLLEQLEKTLKNSETAADAEECCEHLDHLEHLLDKVSLTSLDVSSMDESFVRENYARLSDSRQKIEARAKNRVDELAKAVEELEKFERQLASLHNWAGTMGPLLASRRAQDVSALDVPEEYKELSREFDDWSTVLAEMSDWLKEGGRSENERMQAQMEHAKTTYSDLREKFGEFKHPKSFDEKLEKTGRRLAELEEALDDMTGIDGSLCSEALSECRRLVKKLAELRDDVTSLEKGRDELVAGGILDKPAAASVGEKIRFASKKTNELGLRAEGCVDRLEDCVLLYDQMETRASQVEHFLDQLEHRLMDFASKHERGGEEEANELVGEWNRHEASMRELEDSERLLRERAVRVDERLCEHRRRRADELKRRLDAWSNAVQEMENDEETQLLELDELHQSLLENLKKAEVKPKAELADSLRFLRGDRDRLSSRARRLAAANPRLAGTDMVAEVTRRWEELEGRLERPEEPEKREEHTEITEEMGFPQQVALLGERLSSSAALVDFDKSPVGSAAQYQERIQSLDALLSSWRPTLESVVTEGRRIANSGRLELDSHRAIGQLDEICDAFDNLEQEADHHRSLAAATLSEAESLGRDVAAMEAVVDKLLQRTLEDPQVASATHRDLSDRDPLLSSLSHRASSLHSSLPGSSPSSRDTVLSSLHDKMARLDALLAASARTAANATPIRTSPDRTSASSVLAMEAHGNVTDAYTTEDEAREQESPEKQDDRRKIISPEESSPNRDGEIVGPVPTTSLGAEPMTSSKEEDHITSSKEDEPGVTVAFSQPNTTMMEVDDSSEMENLASHAEKRRTDMQIVYSNLDLVEESLAFEDEFPMEKLEDAPQRHEHFASLLSNALSVVDEQEMTLDMMQAEHTRERASSLRKELEDRRKKVKKDQKEWNKLEQVLFESEKTVATGEAAMEQRQATPPLEEQQQRQHTVEKLLPRAESLTCDAVRRMALILPRLQDGSPRSLSLRDRVRTVENSYRNLVRQAEEGRLRLEAAAVDHKGLKKELQQLIQWCADTSSECSASSSNPLDVAANDEIIAIVDKRNEQLAEKKSSLARLEAAKDRLLNLASVDQETKHETRRLACLAAQQLADLRSDLSDRRVAVSDQKRAAEQFWDWLDALEGRAEDLRRRVDGATSATIYTPSADHVALCRADAEKIRSDVAALKERVQKANSRGEKLGGRLEKRVVDVITLCSSAATSTSALPTSTTRSASLLDESMASSQNTIIDVNGTASIVSSQTTEQDDDETVLDEEAAEPEVAGRMSVSNESQATSHSLPRLSARDESNWQSLTQLRHWLTEVERDASLTVDLAEHAPIRHMANNVQGIMDQIRSKLMDVVGLQDASGAAVVKQKANELASDMDRVARQCDRRRQQLARLADDVRSWENGRTDTELWLANAEAAIGERRAEESSDVAMREELSAVEAVVAELDQRKAAIDSINKKGNAILDEHTRDDAHSLSHQLSRINMRWTKFNDNVRIRRAVLEASLRSRSDFHSALCEFEEWLERMVESVRILETQTSNSQAIKDTAKRRDWNQKHKVLRAELDAHETVLKAVDGMGRKIANGLDAGREKNNLSNRLDALDSRWRAVKETTNVIVGRLESAEQEWERLTHNLSSLIAWIDDKSKEALSQQPVGGSLSSVMTQGTWVKGAERDMEARNPQIKEAVAAANSFLMQHDLRPKLHRTTVLADDDDKDDMDAEQRRCGLQVQADCDQLKEKWAELGLQLADWQKTVQAAAARLQELDAALAECQLHLSTVESELEKARPVESLLLEDLRDARTSSEALAARVDALRIHVDDANDACGKILAAELPLDQHPRNQLDAVNQRFLDLRTTMRIRVAALRNALTDFGPSSEHFLSQSVTAPWQRAISKTNHLPYYIDHTTERTQWEHPVWVEMAKELSQFNRVKFIAYRTAMKLRALQKRLCLDLIDIPMLEKAFTRLGGLSNEECPALEGMVSCLLPLFEQLHSKFPQQVRSVALAVDLCINFLLNLFDPSRDGILRILSFKIALVVFSNAQLEEKYRYLFDLVAQEGQADQKHVALLLYDLIHIPRLVGEAAAFGGSNVEPSVRSCFESVRLSNQMAVTSFLDWLKQEPQSIVWLPVMHRLAAAEFAKHSSKCNVCKMYPIVGLRYRCLRCFNLDLCQNCFFSQRVAKKHKLKHPMQEYAVPTTSSEDARDFAKMVRNKFGRSRSSLGYLPVDVGEEGRPLAAPPAVAHNPATDALHQRTAAMAGRLAELTASRPAEPRDDAAIADVKSPAQLISQVEQMHKDELDQMLQKLQLENIELKRELDKRKAAASTPHLDRAGQMSPVEGRRPDGRAGTLPRMPTHGRSVPSLKSAQSQSDVMDESRALRLHKQRLEHRSRILEQQNEQLELQLQRLKKVIDQQKESSTRVGSWSAERDWAERRSQPPQEQQWEEGDPRTTRMQSLLATVDDLGRAMESLVVSVVYSSESDD